MATVRNTPPAPDDDPRFAEWMATVELPPGPPGDRTDDDLPDVEISAPLTAALVVLAGLSAIVVVLGWAALGFAINLGVASTGLAIVLSIGTLLVIVGGSFAYFGRRRPR